MYGIIIINGKYKNLYRCQKSEYMIFTIHFLEKVEFLG